MGVFHDTEMKLLSAAGAGRWSLQKSIQHESWIHLELYKNNYRHNGIPWRDKFFFPTRDEYTYAANVENKEVANLWNVKKNKQYYTKN